MPNRRIVTNRKLIAESRPLKALGEAAPWYAGPLPMASRPDLEGRLDGEVFRSAFYGNALILLLKSQCGNVFSGFL